MVCVHKFWEMLQFYKHIFSEIFIVMKFGFRIRVKTLDDFGCISLARSFGYKKKNGMRNGIWSKWMWTEMDGRNKEGSEFEGKWKKKGARFITWVKDFEYAWW